MACKHSNIKRMKDYKEDIIYMVRKYFIYLDHTMIFMIFMDSDDIMIDTLDVIGCAFFKGEF